MKKILMFLIISLFLINCVSATDNYHQLNTPLYFSITSNNATKCNLTTINSPNSILIINQEGTKLSRTFNFSVNANNYSEKGRYCHNIECSDSVTFTTGQECYQVNYLGKELTQSQSTVYLGLLVILILIMVATFIGIGYLPNQNEQDPEGKIMSITYLKYFRLPLWVFIYFLAIGIIYLASGIARAFLNDSGFAKLLWAIFIMMFSLSPLIIILIVVYFFIKFYEDKQFQQYLNRGIFPGSDL